MKVIFFYVEGSAEFGLGHLSRVVPLYHNLIANDYKVIVYHYGDNLGEAFLEIHGVEYKSINESTNLNIIKYYTDILWIVDSTALHTRNIEELLKKTDRKILISPVFDSNQINLFHHCIIRSDSHKLPISNKIVSSELFMHDRSTYYSQTDKLTLGIALSGGDSSEKINYLLANILDDKSIKKLINKIRIYVGLKGSFTLPRKDKDSYFIHVEFISSLNSLWAMNNDVNYMIVGNGIIVDECEYQNMPYSIFDDSNNITNKSSISNKKIYLKNEIMQLKEEIYNNLAKLKNSNDSSLFLKHVSKIFNSK